ncbi:MAG: GNAT family N-acetyltransferase [Labilithrix sp.]|nr:GNAT family N-acetyltransferase [Labilithrix sp.]MCW5812719.1 GNAT family N-acetyltransferase [Labilithrix sp.]
MPLAWELKAFADLTPDALYDLLQLRSLVFVVEQTCVFLDPDGEKDKVAWHLLGRDANGRVVAYTRLLAAGVAYDEPSIGRVVTHPDVRRTGAGRELMAESLRRCRDLFGDVPIRIGAQRYLERFYGSFGFVPAGAPYDEDGIPHIHMLRARG